MLAAASHDLWSQRQDASESVISPFSHSTSPSPNSPASTVASPAGVTPLCSALPPPPLPLLATAGLRRARGGAGARAGAPCCHRVGLGYRVRLQSQALSACGHTHPSHILGWKSGFPVDRAVCQKCCCCRRGVGCVSVCVWISGTHASYQ